MVTRNSGRRDLSEVSHDVYHVYDEQRNILYVGCSYSAELRLKGHRSKWWAPLVAFVMVSRYVDRATALRIEASRITIWKPPGNTTEYPDLIDPNFYAKPLSMRTIHLDEIGRF